MSDFEIVAGVFVAVFILGVGVGVIVVIAMSGLRMRRGIRSTRRPPRWIGPRRDEMGLGREEEEGPDDDPPYPRWPRDGGYRG
jgi:hypothetical protein